MLLSTAQSAAETYAIYILKYKTLCLFFLFTLSDAREWQVHEDQVFAVAWAV